MVVGEDLTLKEGPLMVASSIRARHPLGCVSVEGDSVSVLDAPRHKDRPSACRITIEVEKYRSS